MKKKIYVILALCISLSISAIFIFDIFANSKYQDYTKPIYENKQVGKTKHYTKDSDKVYTSVFYPAFTQETLNKAIQEYMKKEITYQSKNKYIHYTDYEVMQTYDYISIMFHQFIYNENHKKLVEQIHTINYDIKADKILTLDDVLRKDYKNMILTLLHKENKSYSIDTLSDFMIEKEGIDLYFNHEEKQKTFIDYQAFKAYIKLQNKNIPSLYQEEINTTKSEDVDPNKPMVAFTFDDGPSNTYTKEIMDAFDSVDGKATFFMLGTQINMNKEIVKEVDKRGFEVANHSYNHKNLPLLSDEEAYKEIMDTQDLIYSLIGKDPKLLRPPYGSLPKINVDDFHMENALWNIDTLDWQSRNAQAIKNSILNNISDGSIILLHDIYEPSSQAIKALLPQLKAQGYQFVSMSTLIKYRYS